MISPMFLAIVDVLLVLGFTLRLVRLVITDDFGIWFVQNPALRWACRSWDPRTIGNKPPPWQSKLTMGLSCPWCVGFWLGCLVLLSLAIAGGPGHAWDIWRYVAGAFTLNWLTGHIGPRLGDAGYDTEDDE